MAHVFRTPDRVVTGCGCISNLPNEAQRFGAAALVVTGKTSLRSSGRLQELMALLDSADLDVIVFSHGGEEPTTDDVDDARQTAGVSKCDMVIAVGGGSVLDLGKAVAALAHAEHDAARYLAGASIEADGLPFIAAPTTSGAGSEVTPNSVLIDPARKLKKSLRAESMMPDVAIVDPELTLTKPPQVTAASGMDALTQAIESFLSRKAYPLTEALSLAAARNVAVHLKDAFLDGSNLEARSAVSYGSLAAGMALANARLGVVHGVVHPLGARFGVPHGVACAALLPHALEFNKECAEKYERLREAVGCDIIEFVRGLMADVNIPERLNEYGLDAAQFDDIAVEAMDSGSTKANPREVRPADVVRLLEKVV